MLSYCALSDLLEEPNLLHIKRFSSIPYSHHDAVPNYFKTNLLDLGQITAYNKEIFDQWKSFQVKREFTMPPLIHHFKRNYTREIGK